VPNECEDGQEHADGDECRRTRDGYRKHEAIVASHRSRVGHAFVTSA
jgi:hypothetical protein